MNSFLQRMLRKNSNEELNVYYEKEKEKEKDEGKQKNETGRSGSSKGNWIRKLGNYSPTKYQALPGPARRDTMKAVDANTLCNSYEQSTIRSEASGSPQTPLNVPDLETIIREFETGFLSPTKQQDTGIEQLKQKNFVKKIVAAFEVKYKSCHDLKMAQDTSDSQENVETTPRRRSKLFSPFKDKVDELKYRADKPDDSKQQRDTENAVSSYEVSTPFRNDTDMSRHARRSGVFGTPFEVSSQEIKAPDRDKSGQDIGKGSMFSTLSKDRRAHKKRDISSRDSSSSSEIYTYPLDADHEDSRDTSQESYSPFRFGKDQVRRPCFLYSPLKVSSLDETRTMDSIDLDATLPEPEETILLEGNALQKTSTMIDERQGREQNDEDDCCFYRRAASVDRTPKVVGAYLKRPIEVEDTSIDWIPITGKKLPRKRSLKKLLNVLTGKRSLEKRSKLFSSERNLHEESRELQDSGYDEKSCSSSSLNSLISITEVLLQQENGYVEPEKRQGHALTTFRPRSVDDEEAEEDEAFCDAYRGLSKRNRKRLLLTEVPREEVKLDLGPSYPPSYKFFTMSLDRRMVTKKAHTPPPVRSPLTRLPKHPQLSKIPKHPFVALTKVDEPQETGHSAQECHSDHEEPAMVIKNDLYEVEFRRSCTDVCSSASCRSSTSVESNYDVPRRFLSKSENELRLDSKGQQKEPIYDVPKPCTPSRPKSSGYEDTISFKSISTQTQSSMPSFYAVPRDLVVPYATVKPRNSHVYLSNDIARSWSDLTPVETRTVL